MESTNTKHNNSSCNNKHFINRAYDEDYLIAPCCCVLTGEEVHLLDFSMIELNTAEGRKLFKLWVHPKFHLINKFDLKELIQDTLGNPINIKQLKC